MAVLSLLWAVLGHEFADLINGVQCVGSTTSEGNDKIWIVDGHFAEIGRRNPRLFKERVHVISESLTKRLFVHTDKIIKKIALVKRNRILAIDV